MKAEEEQLKRFEVATDATGHGLEGTERPSFLIDKTPCDSAIEVLLPFSTDLALREQYINFYGNLRMGKILEDLDACAGNVAHAHADDSNPKTRPLTIVTASVDRIDLLDKLLPDRDMRMTGFVTYVGRSSMEIRVEVESKDPATDRFYPLIIATFTMVATFEGKAAPVNRLVPQTEREKQLFDLGEKNKLVRKELAKASLFTQPPTPDEQKLLHTLFMDRIAGKQVSGTPMCASRIQSVLLCQPQERNRHNKIFGGFLMQKAHELAWTNAHTFTGVRPWFLALDQVSFHKPVNIGSIIFFNSEVVYTQSKAVGVRVIAEVLNPLERTRDKTNSFHFTFTCPEGNGDAPLPAVIPDTYEEAIQYLDGKRRYDDGKRTAETLGSRLLRFY